MLEYIEDQILFKGLCQISKQEYALAEMGILTGFSEAEIRILEADLQFETYHKGDVIIRQGDHDRDLFLLISGIVSAKLHVKGKGHERRLSSINSGVCFGEIAMLDNKPRSVNVVADEDVKLYRLPYMNFQGLQKKEPAIANKLIMNIALILSERMRSSTEEIKVLSEN